MGLKGRPTLPNPIVKIYFAAVYTNGLELHGQQYGRMTPTEKEARARCGNILESYHYVKSQPYVDAMRRDGVKIFLDSGAFSAHTQGVTIDLDAFCRYIKENADIIEVVSVLDSIGNADKTFANQQAMERAGVRPLPCFHYGEDEQWLRHYVANYDYITLGGVAIASTAEITIWLDRIWDRYLTDGAGRPRVKVHGFAITSVPLMRRYPWWSVDSTSWLAIGANGAVLMPTTLKPLHLSETSPDRKVMGRHLDNLTGPERVACLDAIQRRGFEAERLQRLYASRWAFNMNTFQEINWELQQRNRDFKENQIPIF